MTGEILLAPCELGFSSLEAYARERLVRSAGWVRVTRRVADRLSRLPRIRERLVKGPMRWSMAELLARHATAQDEQELLEATAGMTVRQVRAALRDRGEEAEPVERMGTLELSMTFEEACALTATRPMAELVSGSKAPGEWLASMLGEAQDWLTLVAPHADPMPEDVVERHERWLASIEEGERRMDAREARAEGSLPPMPEVSVSPVDELPVGAVAIDRVLFRELTAGPSRDTFSDPTTHLTLEGRPLVVEVYERGPDDDRAITRAALALVERTLASFLRGERPAPPARGEPTLVLAHGMQPGIYHLSAMLNPGEPGRVYVRAFEVTREVELSTSRLRTRTLQTIGSSPDPSALFRYDTELTIYEGNWGQHYAARFEVWFIPASGAAERRLIADIFRIEGWMR